MLNQFRSHGLTVDRLYETNGLQTAIGLVAAGIGVTVVPRSVQRLRRDDVVYKPLLERGVTSPTLMTTRSGELSSDVSSLLSAMLQARSTAPTKRHA